MYEEFFGFRRRPFASAPRTDQYFPGIAIEAARETLVRCVQRSEGPALVVGAPGTGKTLLCQLLAEHFKSELAVALLCGGGLTTRRGLLQAVLFALGQPYRGMDEAELRLSLLDYLTLGDRCPHGMLLLVDEAHTLPLRLLEEIRTITNLVLAGELWTHLVLAGSPALEERLASPKLESFSQRLAARCYLEALNRTETQTYICAAIRGAGGIAEQVFSADACDAAFQATNGVPRLINQLCDHALLLACTAGRREIGAECVREAWSDLQQLPTRWQEQPSGAANGAGGVIEFGQLDDDLEASQDSSLGQASRVDAQSPVLCLSRGPAQPLPEPIERLQRIEQALDALDGEFQPAGSIGPEVEIVFDDPNPFAEEFEEEEVIVDRYAPIGGDPARAKAGASGDPGAAQTAKIQQTFTVENVYCAPMPELQPAACVPPAQAPESRLAAASRGAPPADWSQEPPTLHLHRRDGETDSDDADMIVVEDGYEERDAPHVHAVGAVRKQEYRQLFARLRRG